MVKFMGMVKVLRHIVGPASNRFTRLPFHTNQGPIPETIRSRYDPVILIGRSHSTNADHDRLIRSRKYETKQFIAN